MRDTSLDIITEIRNVMKTLDEWKMIVSDLHKYGKGQYRQTFCNYIDNLMRDTSLDVITEIRNVMKTPDEWKMIVSDRHK